MKTIKRVLSLFLSIAMVVTGVNLGMLSEVQAAETKNERYYREITGTFEHSADGYQITVAANEDVGRTGTEKQAPKVSGETISDDGIIPCGSDRYGCFIFNMPEMDFTQLKSATVKFKVNYANNVNGTNSWVKAALYQTANGEVTASNQSTYAALNNDYSYDAAMWSDKKITNNGKTGEDVIKEGWLSFDVKKAILAAVEKGDKKLVLRLQVPRGGLNLTEGSPITLTIDATTPTTASVEYVDEQGQKIQNDKALDLSVGSRYTYDMLDEEKTLTIDGQEYKYQEDASKTEINEVMVSGNDGAAANNKIMLVYKKVELTSVIAPPNIYAIEGNEPVLPKQVTANTNITDYTTKTNVTWDISDKKWTVGKHTITGTAEGLEGESAKVTVAVQVFECDQDYLIPNTADDVYTADAEGEKDFNNSSKGAMYKFGKKYKGEIITEFDLKTTRKTNNNDKAIIYLDSDQTVGDAWGASTARMYFQGDVFGTTSGEDKSTTYASNTSIDSQLSHDAGQTYRVRMEINSSTIPSNFKVFVTDEKGVETEITQAGGNRFRYYSKGEIQALYLGRYGFTVSNHKIY